MGKVTCEGCELPAVWILRDSIAEFPACSDCFREAMDFDGIETILSARRL